jgi:hypothetical protein
MLSGTTSSSSNSSSSSGSSNSSGEVSLFDAAIATGDLPLLYEVYLRLQRTAWQQWQAKVPSVLQALQAMPVSSCTIHIHICILVMLLHACHCVVLHDDAAVVSHNDALAYIEVELCYAAAQYLCAHSCAAHVRSCARCISSDRKCCCCNVNSTHSILCRTDTYVRLYLHKQDFYVEMHWHFGCHNLLAPLVRAVAPSDTYKVHALLTTSDKRHYYYCYR